MIRRYIRVQLLRKQFQLYNYKRPCFLSDHTSNQHIMATLRANYLNTSSFSKNDVELVQGSNRVGFLSPSVLYSMAHEALAQSDTETLFMLLDQAFKLREVAMIEKILRYYISNGDVETAASIITQCSQHSVRITDSIAKELAARLVNDAHWTESYHAVAYMIQSKVLFSERLLFFTLGGLLLDSKGVLLALELLKLIVLNEREDLAKFVSFPKVCFSNNAVDVR
jgi:hypothetical protein